MRTIRVGKRATLALSTLAVCALAAAPALAQPKPADNAAPAQAAAQPAKQGEPARPAAPDLALPAKGPDPIATALASQPGGLTPDEVAQRALETRRSIRAKQAELRAAQARVDQAIVGLFPRVSASAGYTRLSEVANGGLGGGAIVGALNPGPIGQGPCPPPNNALTCIVDSKGVPIGASSFSFPVLTNVYTLQAQVAVPISDYVLRASQGLAAASHSEKAKRLEIEAEKLQVASDARIAFFNWARARGQVVVAIEAVSQTKAHVNDAKVAETAGLVSRADVLRIEAQLAAAEQVRAEVNAFEALAAEQLRIVIQAPATQPLTLGIDILKGDPDRGGSEAVEALQQQALQRRLEIRALDETQYTLKSATSLARAGYFPRVDAFADVTYANPNQRIFPQRDEWNATWSAGIRASWTINDTFATLPAVAEAKAREEQVAEQKAALMEGLRLEVMSAHADLQKARASIESASRGLAAAEESLRVRQLLFRAGKATSTDLVDAESEATRAQLRRIDAHVGLLVAQTRLAHATGRDVKADPAEK